MTTAAAQPPVWALMNAQRYDADRLLNTCGVVRPPVDVFGIVRLLGVGLERVFCPEDWAGELESSDPSGAVIRYNGNHAPARQRFTVAHEIGHLLLHPPGRRFRDRISSMGVDLAEIQANNFAASLLMPSWMISAAAPGKSISALADIFGVSEQAMQIRLKALGYPIS